MDDNSKNSEQNANTFTSEKNKKIEADASLNVNERLRKMYQKHETSDQTINSSTQVTNKENKAYIFRSSLGVIIALVVFFLVWFVGNAALKILDTVRGNRNLIQDFAREVGMPAIGAYVGMMSVDKYIKKYNKHIVFFTFSAIVIVLIGLSLVIAIPLVGKTEITNYDLVLTALSGITPVGAAYLTYKTKLK
jgi:hypothetical protein